MFTWLLVFGMFIALFRPTHKLPALDGIPLLDLYSYTVFLLIVWALGWLSNPNAKRLQGNTLTLAMVLYTLVIVASVLVSSYTSFFESYWCQQWLRFMILFILLVTGVKTERDMKIVVTAVPIFFFLEMAHIYLGGYTVVSASVERLAVESGRFQRVTQLGIGVACLLPLIFPVVTLCKKYWHYLFVLCYALLTVRIVILTGTRTAFIMLLALFVLPLLFSRYRFRVLSVLFLALPIGWFTMTEDMQNRYRTIWDWDPTINRGAAVSRDSRITGFYDGLGNWAVHPILGTGAGSGPAARLPDGSMSTMPSGFRGGVHNLPGQVAGELGTIGVVAFLFVLSAFGINHYKIWKNCQYLQGENLGKEGLYCWRVSLASLYGVLMLLFMGLGESNAYYSYWIWFAAFQALAAMLMQEKVTAIMQGKLLPSLPVQK